MVPFAGWEMPVQYSGIIDEVRAVREALPGTDSSWASWLELLEMAQSFAAGPGIAADDCHGRRRGGNKKSGRIVGLRTQVNEGVSHNVPFLPL